MDMNVAAQLYTLRDFTRTPAELAVTLARVRRMGYTAVQVSAVGPIDAAELGRLLDGEGLTCCATHVALDRLRDQPDAVVADHRRWRCRYVAVGGHFRRRRRPPTGTGTPTSSTPSPPGTPGPACGWGTTTTATSWPGSTARTALARLVDRLDPAVFLEIDTYWIAHGGGDPAAWIAGLPGRVPCVHLKDMAVHYPAEQRMAEVGEGNLNWPAVLAACRSAGVEWHIVEQDQCYGRDPFESLAISLRNLTAMG